jgi:hypothetical protein
LVLSSWSDWRCWKRGREKAGAAGRVAIAVIAAAAAGKTLGKTASRAPNRFQQPRRLATGGRAFISKPVLVIRKICVNRNFRFLTGMARRGAALLIQRIIAWSREQRLDRLVLHASDEGRALYERLSFIATNEM